MNLKIAKESWGGFRTFDFICFYAFLFFFQEFVDLNLPRKGRYNFFLLFIFCNIIIISGLTAEFDSKILFSVARILPIFIFGRFFILECIKDGDFYTKAINALKIAYIINLAVLFVQMLVGLKFTFYPELNNNVIDVEHNMIRYPGTFYDSQASGQFLAMGSFLFLFIENEASKQVRIFNYVCFALSLLAAYFAGSRSALGGLAVGLIFVAVVSRTKFRWYAFILIAALFIVSSVTNFNKKNQGIIGRTNNVSQDYLFRQSLWSEAFTIAKKFPYIGIGLGNYQNYVKKHVQDQYLEIVPGTFLYFDQPENGYLKIAVELGFIGLITFLLFFIIPLAGGMINFLKGATESNVVLLIASLLSWLVAFTTVYSIEDSRLMIMIISMIVLILTYPLKKLLIYEIE